jgi:cobalt-zinc-cadmium efflux system membrane fusion protein
VTALAWRVGLGLALAACSTPSAPAPAPSAEASSASVRWRPARDPRGTALLEAPARVVAGADSRTLVTAPLRARIVAVRTTLGDSVEPGAALVEIAMPEAAAAAAEYLAAQDQLAAYERRATQLAELRKEGLSRAADVATVELEVARLRGERDRSATTLRAASLPVGDSGALAARGGRVMLRAPRAGVVTRLSAVVGATGAPDEVLVELSGGGSTRVEVALAYPLPPDAGFEVAIGEVTSRARLVGLAPDRDADGTRRAWFEAEQSLPAGASGRLRVILGRGAVTVPATAVATDGGGAYVWKRAGGPPVRVAVEVLATSGGDALVVGPAEGDSIASVAGAVTEVAP